MHTLLIVYWLSVLIRFVLLQIRCDKPTAKTRNTWRFTNNEKKKAFRLCLLILVAHVLEHTFQFISLETFHSEKSERRVKCEEKIFPAESNRSVRIIDVLEGRECPALLRNRLLSPPIIEETRTYHIIKVRSKLKG